MTKEFHELKEVCHYVRVGKSVKKNLFILEKRQAIHSSYILKEMQYSSETFEGM